MKNILWIKLIAFFVIPIFAVLPALAWADHAADDEDASNIRRYTTEKKVEKPALPSTQVAFGKAKFRFDKDDVYLVTKDGEIKLQLTKSNIEDFLKKKSAEQKMKKFGDMKFADTVDVIGKYNKEGVFEVIDVGPSLEIAKLNKAKAYRVHGTPLKSHFAIGKLINKSGFSNISPSEGESTFVYTTLDPLVMKKWLKDNGFESDITFGEYDGAQ